MDARRIREDVGIDKFAFIRTIRPQITIVNKSNRMARTEHQGDVV